MFYLTESEKKRREYYAERLAMAQALASEEPFADTLRPATGLVGSPLDLSDEKLDPDRDPMATSGSYYDKQK